MTIQEVAEMMNGREYLNELTEKEEELLKESGIVVVFGYSDDNVELRGAVDEELGAWEETEFHMTETGLLMDCGSWNQCKYQGYGELHPQDWYCADGVRKGEEESDA